MINILHVMIHQPHNVIYLIYEWLKKLNFVIYYTCNDTSLSWEITPASETYLLMFQSEKHLSVNHRFDIRQAVCQIKEDGWVFGNSLFSSLVAFVNHIILLICAMAINDSSKLWFFLRIGVLLLFRVAILTWWVIKVVIGQPSNHTEHPRSNIK